MLISQRLNLRRGFFRDLVFLYHIKTKIPLVSKQKVNVNVIQNIHGDVLPRIIAAIWFASVNAPTLPEIIPPIKTKTSFLQ